MQLSCLEELTSEHIQTKEKELERFELEVLNLDVQLKSFKSCLEDFVKKNPLPNTVIGFGNLYKQVMQDFAHISKV